MTNTNQKKIFSAYETKNPTLINFEQSHDCCKQSFADETDINSIMRRYAKTGLIESSNETPRQYGVASAFDFQEAQNTIILAQNLFNQLPSQIRSFFQNDPEKMLEYMDNPANHPEAIKMGLLPTLIVEPIHEAAKPTVAPSSPLSDPANSSKN